MNNNNISIILKEIVRRVIIIIQQERFLKEYSVDEKTVDYKVGEDFVTSADKKAQKLYLKLLQENFPGYGIIAEEDDLDIKCTIPGKNLYFFVDPLDGTKAYIRKQSHATSTMLALVDLDSGEYLSCMIGDINTGEIYYFKPESDRIRRVTDFEQYEELFFEQKDLSEQYLLLRDDVRLYSEWVQHVTDPKNPDKIFKDIEIEGGSIGTMIMRLIKGEVGAIGLKAGTITPWDANPVDGFLSKMGYTMIDVTDKDNLKELSIAPIKEKKQFPERILIHKNHLKQLMG